jgi:hypothetical protein
MRETNPVNSLELIGEFAVGVKNPTACRGRGARDTASANARTPGPLSWPSVTFALDPSGDGGRCVKGTDTVLAMPRIGPRSANLMTPTRTRHQGAIIV